MKVRVVKFWLPILLVTMACSLSTPKQPETPTAVMQEETPRPVAVSPQEAEEMNCSEMGLPCTLEEADPAILERGVEIFEELKSRLGQGENIESLQGWLESLDGMRVVLSSPVSLMFVLEGGLPLGIYDAVLAGGYGEPDAEASAGSKVLASYNPPYLPLNDVVGQGTSRENDERQKHALILSPFEFEFKIPDVGTEAVRILGAIPDYRGRVTYYENEAVGVDAFRGWQHYDLILYNGHGGTLTGVDSKTGTTIKTTFITTGTEQTSCKLQKSLQGVGAMDAYPPGVNCIGVKVRVENMFGRAEDVFKDYLGINPIFFKTAYPSGLEKAVIIFNGCVTFVSDFLPARLSGKDSVYFGWDQNVLSHFNPGPIRSLLSELAKGYPSERAYEKACGNSACVDSAGLGATLQRHQAGEDLRIREIAMSLHPLTGDPLKDGEKVPLYGYPADHQVDELPFYIEVMAVEFEEISDYTIRFEVNGKEIAETWKLDDPDAVEKWEAPDLDTYRILDRMVLPFDFQQDQEIKVVIKVDLPEGGVSQSVLVKPKTRNPVFGLESYFGADENGLRLDSYVSGEVPLSLVEIKEDIVSFESKDRPDLLHYDSFEVEVPQCSVEPKTQGGSINVLKAVFPKDGFTNIQVPIPDEFTFVTTNTIREDLVVDCAGGTTNIPYLFWLASFNVANEDRFTDEGIQISEWNAGSGGVYAEFFWESDLDPLEGEFTLRIREP